MSFGLPEGTDAGISMILRKRRRPCDRTDRGGGWAPEGYGVTVIFT